VTYDVYLTTDSDEERNNYDSVVETMNEVMKTPTVIAGQIMPDACPAGPV